MPTETLQVVIDVENRGGANLAQAVRDLEHLNRTVQASRVGFAGVTREVNDLSNAMRILQGAGRVLDLFNILPFRLGQQLSYVRYAFDDISRQFGNAAQRTSQFIGSLGGVEFGFSDDVIALNRDLLAVEQASTSAASGLTRFGAVAVTAGVAAAGLAFTVGKIATELGNYGQIVVQTEKRFQAFSGSALQAAENIKAIRSATDYGISAMDAMQNSAMLMSMGLADSGEKAGQLIRLALMLGPAWRSAEQNINDFTMLLANQSVRRLDQFGLSISQVKQRQKELMDLGFASDLAFTNSVIEIGTQRMKELEEAGVRVATGSRKLQAAWADLRAEISKPFAGPISAIESDLAAVLSDFTTLLQLSSGETMSRLSGLQTQLQKLEEQRAQIIAGTARGTMVNEYYIPPPSLKEVEEQIARVRREMDYLTGSTKAWGEAASDVGVGVAVTMQRVRQEMDDLNAKYEDAIHLLGQMTPSEKLNFLNKNISATTKSVEELRSKIYEYGMLLAQQKDLLESGDVFGAKQIERALSEIDIERLRASLQTAEQMLRALSEKKIEIQAEINLVHPLDPWRLFLNRQAEPGQYGAWYNEPPTPEEFRTVLANVRAADKTQEAFERAAENTQSAFNRVASAIGDKFNQAIDISIRLRDFRVGGANGIFAPGANGPFEDIYRLQAWLTDNSWGNIAERYGITSKEQGADIVRKFQLGLWDESVTRLIDAEAIKRAVLTEQQAAAYKKAFAERIAAATGTGTDVVSAVIYGEDYTNAEAQTRRMVTAGQDMAGGLITGIKKSEQDLWQAGYNAALAMQAGWNAAVNERSGGVVGNPPNDVGDGGYSRTGRSIGMN